jgi:hypothetical protein
MSSNQEQPKKDLNLHIGLSIFNTQVIRSIFSDNKLNQSVENFDRRESNPSNTLSPGIDYQVTRRSSAPSISK